MFMRWATLDKSLYPSFLRAQKGAKNAFLLGCEKQIYNWHLTLYFLEFACRAIVVSIDHLVKWVISWTALKSMDTSWGLKRQCPGQNCSQDLGVVIQSFSSDCTCTFPVAWIHWEHSHPSTHISTTCCKNGTCVIKKVTCVLVCGLCQESSSTRLVKPRPRWEYT